MIYKLHSKCLNSTSLLYFIMVHASETPTKQPEEIKRNRSASFTLPKAKVLRPFNTCEVKVLLLENINETAVTAFKKQGYQVRLISSLYSFV